MSRDQHGPANPNWKGGSYSNWDDGFLNRRWQLQAKLREVMSADLEKNPPTNEEAKWALAVSREWPEWAHDTLISLGFSRPEHA